MNEPLSIYVNSFILLTIFLPSSFMISLVISDIFIDTPSIFFECRLHLRSWLFDFFPPQHSSHQHHGEDFLWLFVNICSKKESQICEVDTVGNNPRLLYFYVYACYLFMNRFLFKFCLSSTIWLMAVGGKIQAFVISAQKSFIWE